VCRDCGNVSQVDVDVASSLTGAVRKAEGFEVDLEHFAIYGRCRDCAGASTQT
jgi:Fur family ferric uptake transcriptional regulator